MAMHISCTKVCMSCCISHSFALGGKYGQPYGPRDHVPPHVWAVVDDPSTASEMIVKMMKKTFVLCVVTNAPPKFVGSAMRSIVLDVLTLTLVG